MPEYILLLFALLALGIVAFHCSGKQVLSPGPTAAISMSLATVLAIVGLSSWNAVSLSWGLIGLLVFGTGCFAVGSTLVHVLISNGYIKKCGRVGQGTERGRLPFSLEALTTKRILILLVVMLVIVGLHVVETYRVANEMGIAGDSYASLIKQIRFRTNTVFNGDAAGFDVGYSFVDRQLQKVGTAITYVSTVLVPLLVIKRRPAKQCALMVGLYVIGVTSSLFSGGRYGTMMYLVALVLATWVVLVREKPSEAKRMSALFLGACAMLGVVALGLFYCLSSVVGREAGSSPVEYLSFYLGCGIPSFQVILNEGAIPYAVQGFNTFHEQMFFLSKFGAFADLPGFGSYFINLGGHASNVFTFVYRYYADYGVAGVASLSVLSGAGFGALYELGTRVGRHPLWLIPCVKSGALILDVCRDEKFFSGVLTVSNVLTVVIAAVAMVAILIPAEYLRNPSSLLHYLKPNREYRGASNG